MSSQTLYEKYGGFTTISALVNLFYQKIGNTPALDKYFENTDMAKLIDHQTKFLCMVLGGPNNYEGRQLAQAHQKLSITNEHFELVGSILKESLEEKGVEPKDIETILGVVWGTRNDIVNQNAS
jgi:hemoglobin